MATRSQTLASGNRSDSATEELDLSAHGAKGIIVVSDVTAIGNGHSYVDSADITLPVVIDSTHNQFNFNGDEYVIASATYASVSTLAAAVAAAVKSGPVAFSTVVGVTAHGAKLRFTSVASGVHAEAFDPGATHDAITRIGLTGSSTIADTEAAGADGAFSQTLTVQGIDTLSGKTWDLLVSTAQASISTRVLQVHPQMAALGNLVAAQMLPENIRVKVTHTSNNEITRTINAHLTY